ncbi:hypothetical protein ACFV14_31135 [Streptomyces zaomyceticus]|uniref:hypothetical protein n=1 Tax=Streptomyces zaomyceticus TaxID=68286 RepID=UPI0036C6F7E1
MDWWLTDSEGIVAFWLLVFALCNGLRGIYCWFRDRDERRVVERLLAFKPHPVQASFLLGAMTEAAETAVCMLVDDGAVKVSSTGELRPSHRGRRQTDHALRALAEAIRATPSGTTTRLHEIPTEERFAAFRQLVEHRAPRLHLTASGKSQSLMLATSLLTTFGMGVHAGGAMAPTAFFPEAHRMSWLYVCMAALLVQWAPACLWPSEKRRRWKALDTVCRDRTEIARAALPDSTRQAIARTKERPKPPPPPPQPTRHRTRGNSGDTCGAGINADSCGSGSDSGCGGCGGCGGE